MGAWTCRASRVHARPAHLLRACNCFRWSSLGTTLTPGSFCSSAITSGLAAWRQPGRNQCRGGPIGLPVRQVPLPSIVRAGGIAKPRWMWAGRPVIC